MSSTGRLLGKTLKYGLLLGGGAFLAAESIYDVDGGKRAVIWDRFKGVKPLVIGEGTHIKIPWIQYPKIFDIRIKPRIIQTFSGTRDLQTVTVTIRLLSRPEVKQLPKIFKTLGLDYDERVLPAICNEIMKAIIAHRDAEELLTKRFDFYQKIYSELKSRAAEFDIVVEDVSIVDLQFGKEFTHAIEQKVVAQQQAEMAKFVVQRAEQEKLAEIIRAEGESTSAMLINKSLSMCGQGLIEIRKIEAARDIARTLARANAVTYLPGKGGNVLLNLPVN